MKYLKISLLLSGSFLFMSGCALTPPPPPSCSESNAGLKPINPEKITQLQLKTVQDSIRVKTLNDLERISQ